MMDRDIAKQCLRDCVARDDFHGLQQLKRLLPDVSEFTVRLFIDELRPRWGRLRAEYLSQNRIET